MRGNRIGRTSGKQSISELPGLANVARLPNLTWPNYVATVPEKAEDFNGQTVQSG